MKNPPTTALTRSIAFAFLAMAPILVERGVSRALDARQMERDIERRHDERADLIEARLESSFDRYLVRAREIAKYPSILNLVRGATPAERADRRAIAAQRLADATTSLSQGIVARIIDGEGRIVVSSMSADPTDIPGTLGAASSDRRTISNPVLRGRARLDGADGFEFRAPILQNSDDINSGGGLASNISFVVSLWVPASTLDHVCDEFVRYNSSGARVLVFDRLGVCLIDTGDQYVRQRFAAPLAAEIESWQKSLAFGKDTEKIIRSAAGNPHILGALRDYSDRPLCVRNKNLQIARVDAVIIFNGDSAAGEFTVSDTLALALALLCGVTVFIYFYGKEQNVVHHLETSRWPPVLAGAAVFSIILGSTIYATYALDEKGNETARSYSGLVEKSLVDELQNAIATRAAYFAQLDDRLVEAAEPKADFMSLSKYATETYPEGILAYWNDLDDKDQAPLCSAENANVNFSGSAELPEGFFTLERPSVYLTNEYDTSHILFDAPLRNKRYKNRSRIVWCFDLAKLCNVIFSPSHTSGFDVFLMSAGEPGRSIAPTGLRVAPSTFGSIIFTLPKDGGREFRLALRPRVDLFGKQTSRTVVLYVGSLLACAGSIAMALVVSALGTYRRASRVDPLTGLYNRIEFDDTLGREVARAQRHGRSLTLAMIDLDHFKQVNDTFGHAVGDDVLRRVSEELKHLTRGSDTIFRHGGEEFAVILPETPEQAALIVIERVRESFAKKAIADNVGPITFSCGVAEWDGRESTDRFLVRADAALYQAKKHGRNRVLSAQVLKIAESLQMWPVTAQ